MGQANSHSDDSRETSITLHLHRRPHVHNVQKNGERIEAARVLTDSVSSTNSVLARGRPLLAIPGGTPTEPMLVDTSRSKNCGLVRRKHLGD